MTVEEEFVLLFGAAGMGALPGVAILFFGPAFGLSTSLSVAIAIGVAVLLSLVTGLVVAVGGEP